MSERLVSLLQTYNIAVPRYTSYPTAPVWGNLMANTYVERLVQLGQKSLPLSLYFHIPFCKTMCLFCACSVVLNRKPENEERYVAYLCKEIELVANTLGKKKEVIQLHFGGGTPTKLTHLQLERIFATIKEHFILLPNAEIAIEIDPRTVFEDEGSKLESIKALGFNRVSFGVQDTNEAVQAAVKRNQSYSVTKYTLHKARRMEFQGINVDLIYGLPRQSIETFSDTIDKVIELRPDRLALFSFALVPWLKSHQKAIPSELLPTTSEKFGMYAMARKRLIESGYLAIGMDHFALADDELAKAYAKKSLQRNFQGYTVLPVDDVIGFGITAIGFVQGTYVQNAKELAAYYELLDANTLPCIKGKVLTEDDLIRRWVIQRLMCDFIVVKSQLAVDFDAYFKYERELLLPFIEEGFVQDRQDAIVVAPEGELFIRNITSCFDVYYTQNSGHRGFSKGV